MKGKSEREKNRQRVTDRQTQTKNDQQDGIWANAWQTFEKDSVANQHGITQYEIKTTKSFVHGV